MKLREIARSLGGDILLKKTSERLSRNLKEPGLGDRINEIIAGDGAGRVKEDTLIVVDATDIHKACARRMPYLDRVRDGNTGETVVKEEQGQEKKYHLEYGFRKVKLPGREEELFLVVVKGLRHEPLLLLTSLPLRRSR